MRAAQVICLWVAGLALVATPALSDERQVWFDKATQVDLGGGEDAARAAYGLYRRAAEAGLPEAEFNLAVMLDSGRGVDQDMATAATWYARAAAHGNQRAAYNLGQLYEAGQGVPRNVDLARAWFAASGLAAARERLSQLGTRAKGHTPLIMPVAVAPAPDERIAISDGGVELVWLAPAQAEPVTFAVELRRLGSTSSEEIFSGQSKTSSLLASVPDKPGDYAWRVLAVAGQAGRYAPSAWTVFHVTSSSLSSEAANPKPVRQLP